MTKDADQGALDATASAVGTPSGSSVSTTPRGAGEPLAPGATLGRYVLVEELGAGGMGMVFRARDPDLGREVAVKVLRGDGIGSGGSLERRLLREAQAMATISHDNLATVFDIATSEGRVFIAMELLDGGTLRALIADPAKTWRDKLEAVVSAGRGLAAAHTAGVIHRDFKPDNVLLARTGRVKVVDFGLARADRDAEPPPAGSAPMIANDLAAQLTQTGALLGTPVYMAPEQHAGDAATTRSDQFSFAVTAWQAVYGERPFASADGYAALVVAVRAGVLTPPRVPGVPAALEAVLRRALSVDPAARYPSMDDLLAAITTAIAPRRRAPWIYLAIGGVLVVGSATTYLVVRSGGTPSSSHVARVDGHAITISEGSDETADQVIVEDDDGMELQTGDDDDDEGGEQVAVAAVVTSHQRETRACADKAGIHRGGTVTIEFDIGQLGRVKATRIVHDDFPTTGLAACLAAASIGWQFPPPSSGETTVVFPMIFGARGELPGLPGVPSGGAMVPPLSPVPPPPAPAPAEK